VFDVVHMFSERSISAVPIIDEDGIVVNMYETVDVIVCHLPYQICYTLIVPSPAVLSDAGALGSLSVSRAYYFRSIEAAITRFPGSCDMYRIGLPGHATSTYQEAEGSPSRCCGGRGKLSLSAEIVVKTEVGPCRKKRREAARKVDYWASSL
jgi:hypothetical protein